MTTQALDATQPDSAILSTMSSRDDDRPRWSRFASRWARLPRELGFLLAGFPVTLLGFVLIVPLFSFGVSTTVLVGGVFVVVATLVVARWFGTVELVRLKAAGLPHINRPPWNRHRRPGVAGWLRHYLGNGHYWLYLLHGGVVNFAVGVSTWCVSFTWLVGGLGGVFYGIWSRFLPERGSGTFWLSSVIVEFAVPGIRIGDDHAELVRNETVLNALFGVALLATLPFVTHSLVRIHHAIARVMLGSFASDDLKREVAALGASRDAAVSAEDHSLRRLERDIHDGPQQRLVRLQFDLASAERALATDPQRARELLAEARRQSYDTLEELRELSRGFAPPLLQDRGLRAALESLAARSTVPASIRVSIDADERIAPEIERSAYFIVAELLANVAKHSNASSATVTVSLSAAPSAVQTLELAVGDDGVGGVMLSEGHGLSGLAERVSGLRGAFSITSPVGGPTVVAARIPLS